MANLTRPDVPHGVYRYRKFACRCDVCRIASSERKKYERHRDSLDVQPLIDRFGETFLKDYPKMVDRWRERGITSFEADKICCRRGYHPYEIYGDAWFETPWKEQKK